MKNLKKKSLLVGIVAAIFAVTFALNIVSAPFAAAQEEKLKEDIQEEKTPEEYILEPITVFAPGKREEKVQDVPASITVLSDVQIEDSGIVNMHNVALHIPNFHLVDRGERLISYPYIRGIGVGNPLNPVVALYVDDVCHSTFGATFDLTLHDIERIEVLRGPQGTLYGRNSLGGVINIVTKKAGNQWEGNASVDYGNYDSQDYRAALRGPIIKNRLFINAAVDRNKRDGYYDNDYLGTNPDEEDGLAGRVNFRWLPADALDITLGGDFERVRENADFFTDLEHVRKDPRHISRDFDGFSDADTNNQWLRLAYEAPWFKLISVTGRNYWENDKCTDTDFSPADMMRSYMDQDETEYTQEVRIQSLEDSGSFKWLVGGNYYKEDRESNYSHEDRTGMLFGMGPGARMHDKPGYDNWGFALFGQVTYTLFDKLGLTAGLRYAQDEMDFKYESFFEAGGMTIPMQTLDLHDDWNVWLPKFAIDYHFTSSLMTYASVTRGYNSGGFNINIVDPKDASFDPEYTWNYEIGLKSSWLNNRLIANLAAFYIEWDDKQIQRLITPMIHCTSNAGEAHSQGFELELIARPVTGLEFVAGYGYIEAEFDEYEDLRGNFDGNTLPFAPRYTYNMATQYRHSLWGSTVLFGRVELQGTGKLYFDETNAESQGAYELVNAKVGFETGHFDVYIWGKNLFDEEYVPIAFEFPGTGWLGTSSDPCTFGIGITGRF